jgi:hypothetical protein
MVDEFCLELRTLFRDVTHYRNHVQFLKFLVMFLGCFDNVFPQSDLSLCWIRQPYLNVTAATQGLQM